MNWKTASLIALVVLVACVWWLALNKSIFGTSTTTIAIQVLAISLLIWARFTFGLRSFHAAANPTAGGLVRRGPYRYIRHPIYAAVLYFIWAAITAHASVASVGVGLLASAMTALRMVAEEHLMVRTYPEYEEYARTTKRLVPFFL
jgi:protein-S-isoprenylcysteine O-methyltransferase Ste14